LDGLSFATHFSTGVASDTFLQHYAPNVPHYLDAEMNLSKRHFVIRALGNRSFVYAMESMRITGFATLGADCVFNIETETRPEQSGWLLRARRSGLNPDEHSAVSTLSYNETTDTFVLRPEVEAYLRQALREQNIYGLNEEAKDTAGPIVEFALPVSRGCPVTTAIGKTCLFAAKAVWCTL
jgi:hypothetical protein